MFETPTDVARFTLLRVAYAGWKAMAEEGDSSTVMELIRQLTDKMFTDPHDPGSVWERIYAGLIPRLAGVASDTLHRQQQDEAAAIMAVGLPLLEQDPTLRDEFTLARCHALLFLSSDPVYGNLAGRCTSGLLAGGLVSVRLQPEPTTAQTRPASGRKQPHSTSRARQRKR
ncbi:hypothetical protein OG209_39825 [Streptomyces sp. NBC_01383]|uniref:hypothetical protein n=1 Tax=Streptomyces sp. NBC_01383 TaxID=2903846 RepID=UPI00324D5E35